jgi:hypothetical protein
MTTKKREKATNNQKVAGMIVKNKRFEKAKSVIGASVHTVITTRMSKRNLFWPF